jgi:hypothetical protein
MHIAIELYLYTAVWLPVIILVMALRPGPDFPPGSALGAIGLAFAFGLMTWAALLTLDLFFA